MSHGQRASNKMNKLKDLWKPGPTSGWSKCAFAKKIGRRIIRHKENQKIRENIKKEVEND